MKKLLYISVHEVLEYDELKLFTELGYDCFSLGGAYADPRGHHMLKRPSIEGMEYRPDLIEWSTKFPRTEIPEEFINMFDAVIVMDGYAAQEIIEKNWSRLKKRPVVWRTIGQSIPEVERRMRRFRNEGMKIVRYSPMEERLSDYIGGDALIRFYKDPEEFKDWTGHDKKVVNLTQTLKGRRDFCGYDFAMKVGPGLPFKVFGDSNEDLGEFNGGKLPYELMKGQLRDSRVFFYLGTWPASYTLGFIEAWMTGIPVIARGPDNWRHKNHLGLGIYEIPSLIDNGDNGFFNDDPEKLKSIAKKLLEDDAYARQIGEAGRKRAIEVFGKERIRSEWKTFIDKL